MRHAGISATASDSLLSKLGWTVAAAAVVLALCSSPASTQEAQDTPAAEGAAPIVSQPIPPLDLMQALDAAPAVPVAADPSAAGPVTESVAPAEPGPEPDAPATEPVEPSAPSAAASTTTPSGDSLAIGAAPNFRLESNGSYVYDIDLAIPGFRGLEPDLGLHYDSAQKTTANNVAHQNWLGVGWSFRDFSVIERQAIGGGVPYYYDEDLDEFSVDGHRLVKCIAGMTSPSCTSGGSHTGRWESYRRIKRFTGPNRWEVHAKDGTKLTYHAMAGLSADYRWLLSSVTDTHNNSVAYTWWCDSGNGDHHCYPDKITYNGTEITFYREVRPARDDIVYGAGEAGGYSVDVKRRIRTVAVRTGGQMVRAYALTYGQAANTRLSRLIKVQQYGKDAVVDSGSGAVTAGTSLPPWEFSWSDINRHFLVETWLAGYDDTTLIDSTNTYKPNRFVIDMNGDGRSDLIYVSRTYASGGDNACTLAAKIRYSTGSGFTAEHNASTTWGAVQR